MRQEFSGVSLSTKMCTHISRDSRWSPRWSPWSRCRDSREICPSSWERKKATLRNLTTRWQRPTRRPQLLLECRLRTLWNTKGWIRKTQMEKAIREKPWRTYFKDSTIMRAKTLTTSINQSSTKSSKTPKSSPTENLWPKPTTSSSTGLTIWWSYITRGAIFTMVSNTCPTGSSFPKLERHPLSSRRTPNHSWGSLRNTE